MAHGSLFTGISNAHQALSDLLMVTKVELDADKITALMARLDVTLRHHFEIEDEVLYPALLAVVHDWEDRTVLLGAHEDHRVMMRILDDLEDTVPTDERFRGKVHTLDRFWAHHVQEEEGALCDLASIHLAPAEFNRLIQEIRTAEKAQRERLEALEREQTEGGLATETAQRESRQRRHR